MTLDKIATPTERRRAIRYAKDGCKPVRHWYEVQHIAGPLYMGNTREDEYHQPLFDLFLFYDGISDGLFYQSMAHPDWYTPEKLMESVDKIGLRTKEDYLNGLENMMNTGRFVGNADIAFVRQWNTERADVFAAYRERRLEQQREKEYQRYLEQQAKEARKKAEAEAAVQADKAKYLGWADNMTTLRFGKVHAYLDKLIRVDGEIMSRRDFVITTVKDGWTPKMEENASHYYGRGWNVKESKPKTEYRLVKESMSYTVSKTEYDFAIYIEGHKEVLS